ARGMAGTAADVERVASQPVDVRSRPQNGLDEVVDKEDVPHLKAVAVNRERLSEHRRDDEVRDPALVLRAELMWPVDAAHPEDDGPEAERTRIVEDVLLGHALGAAVGAVKLQTAILSDTGCGQRG